MNFPIAASEPVITSSYVLEGEMPILYVSHDYDEESESGGSWQFHSGNGDYSPDKMKLVRLDTKLRIDPSISEVSDLPIGFGARRVGLGAAWNYTPEE